MLPERLARPGALAASLLVLAISLPLWFGFDPADSGYQFVEQVPWIAQWGVSYHLGIDGVSLLLILLTTGLTPLILLAGFSGVEKNFRGYAALMLALEGAMIGTFVALDVFLFYIFWELVLLPMYFLIGIWGGERRIYAAVKLFIYTAGGSLLMLVALLGLYYTHFEQMGAWSTDTTPDRPLTEPRMSELLPDPATPVTTTSTPSGMSTSTVLRLCVAAPRTSITPVRARTFGLTLATVPRWRPVRVPLSRSAATVPVNTTSPPAEPAPGPMSTTWSAMAITSGLCSTTSTVLPLSRRRRSSSFMRWMSWGCSPMVGSSKM